MVEMKNENYYDERVDAYFFTFPGTAGIPDFWEGEKPVTNGGSGLPVQRVFLEFSELEMETHPVRLSQRKTTKNACA